MSYQSINRGSTPNDNTGDTLRDGANKINLNFEEIYTNLGDGTNITFNVATYTSETQTLTNKTIDSANNTLILGFDDLYDVSIPIVPSNGQVLKYDTGAAGWVASIQDVKGVVKSDLIPDTDGVYDLGSSGNKFKDLYLDGNSIYLGTTIISSANGTLQFSEPIADINLKGHIVPDEDETYDLGTANNKFRSLFLSSNTLFLGDSSLSVTSDGLSFVKSVPKRLLIDSLPIVVNANTVQEYNSSDPDAYHFIKIQNLGAFAGMDWPQKLTVDNHFEFNVGYTAKLRFHNPSGKVVASFDLLAPDANTSWVDNGSGNFQMIGINDAKGFMIESPLGDIVIKYPVASGQIAANWFASDYSGLNISSASFEILDIRNETPSKPLKAVDNPLSFPESPIVPTTNTSPGVKGTTILDDGGFLYICHEANTWVRLPVETSW